MNLTSPPQDARSKIPVREVKTSIERFAVKGISFFLRQSVRDGIYLAFYLDIMKQQLFKYTVGIWGMIWCMCTPVSANVGDNVSVFIDILNEVRTAPYEYAMGLGYTPQDLAAKGIGPETRFPAYWPDTTLKTAAAQSVREMMGHAETPVEPIHLFTADTGGIISFFYFMTADTAARILINNLFKAELDTGVYQYILSSLYVYAGGAVKAGAAPDGSGSNAWFLSLHFGSVVLKEEVQLLNLINQVRAAPTTLRSLMPDGWIAPAHTGINWELSLFLLGYKQLTPVYFDNALFVSARQNSNILAAGKDPLSELPSPWIRSQFFGYQGDQVKEFTIKEFTNSAAVSSSMDMNAQVLGLFQGMFSNGILPGTSGEAVFSETYLDAGIGIAHPQSGVTDDDGQTGAAFLTVNWGRPIREAPLEDTPQGSKIYGVLFMDKDGNARYTPGEEIAGGGVIVYEARSETEALPGETPGSDMNTGHDTHANAGDVAFAVSDNAGRFVLTLPQKGNYRFRVTHGQCRIDTPVAVTGDRFVKLFCSVPPVDDSE